MSRARIVFTRESTVTEQTAAFEPDEVDESLLPLFESNGSYDDLTAAGREAWDALLNDADWKTIDADNVETFVEEA